MSNAAEQPAAATSSTPPTPVAPSPDTIATPVDDKGISYWKLLFCLTLFSTKL